MCNDVLKVNIYLSCVLPTEIREVAVHSEWVASRSGLIPCECQGNSQMSSPYTFGLDLSVLQASSLWLIYFILFDALMDKEN